MRRPDIVVYAVLVVIAVLAVLFIAFSESEHVFGLFLSISTFRAYI